MLKKQKYIIIELMNSFESKPNLYLDIDGVIYPFASDEETEEQERASVPRNEIARRLGSTCLNIVWCSSRSERSVSFTAGTEDMKELGDTRILDTRNVEDTRPWAKRKLEAIRWRITPSYFGEKAIKTWIETKFDAISADQKDNPLPFVWVDDDLNDEITHLVETDFANQPHLLIRPTSTVGISIDELTNIEAFAKRFD